MKGKKTIERRIFKNKMEIETILSSFKPQTILLARAIFFISAESESKLFGKGFASHDLIKTFLPCAQENRRNRCHLILVLSV